MSVIHCIHTKHLVGMVFYKYLSLTDPHIVVAAVGRWYNRDVFS